MPNPFDNLYKNHKNVANPTRYTPIRGEAQDNRQQSFVLTMTSGKEGGSEKRSYGAKPKEGEGNDKYRNQLPADEPAYIHPRYWESDLMEARTSYSSHNYKA